MASWAAGGDDNLIQRWGLDCNGNADDASALRADLQTPVEEATQILLALDGKVGGVGQFIPKQSKVKIGQKVGKERPPREWRAEAHAAQGRRMVAMPFLSVVRCATTTLDLPPPVPVGAMSFAKRIRMLGVNANQL